MFESIVAGDVELKQLFLKGSAFDAFNIPISVTKGSIGLFKMKIPWKTLGSDSVVVEISDVYLLVRPKKCCPWNEKDEVEKQDLLKQQKLDTFEVLKSQQDKQEKKEDNSDSGFFAKLGETVVNNLQVIIKNVHMRYEDNSNPSNPVVLGFTLEDVTIGSCNRYFEKTFITEVRGGNVYKILEMSQLSIYLNNYEKSLFSTREKLTNEDFASEMKILISKEKDYIVRPVSGTLQLTLQQGQLNLNFPKTLADIKFDKVDINLDDNQYKNILHVIDYMSNYEIQEMYRKEKPKEPFKKENSREWLNFAIEQGKKALSQNYFSWKEVLQRKKERIEYVQLYKRKKELPWLEKLEGKDLERFNEIERKLSYEDLILFRGFAQAEIDLELEKNSQYMNYLEKKKKKAQAWFSWGTEDEGEAPAVFQISEDQRSNLYKQIGYTKTKEIQTLSIPETYVKFKFLVGLKKGKVSMKDQKTNRDIVEANIDKLCFDIGLREKSVIVKVGLGAFEILDKFSTNSFFPKILSKRENDPNSEKDLASLEVEYKPPESKTDLKVSLLLNRTDIVFNVPLVQKILAFFIIPPEVDLGYIETQAMQQLTFLQKQAQTQLKLAIESKMIIDVKVLIDAPSFIIPENCSEENPSIFVLDLGQLEIISDIEIEERLKRIKNQNAKEIDFYDNYKLKMSDIQMIISNYLDWKNKNIKGRMQNQLLEKVSFDLNFLQCITPENDQLAKMILNGKMTSVIFNISPYKLELMMKILNNVLRLADNPTGVSNYKLLASSYVEIDGPIHSQKEWKKYWVEIRENMGILLYQNQTNLKNFARINLLHSNISINESNVDEKLDSFKLILPQGSNPSLEFDLAFSSTDEKKKWINIIKEVQLSHIQYLKGIGASIEKEDKPVQVVIEDERSVTQPIIKAQFSLDEFSVLLAYQRKFATEEEILCDLRFKSLNIGFEMRNFDMGLTMQLETLYIANLLKGAKDQYVINSKHTKDKNALAELSFQRATQKKSPKYSEKSDAILDIKLQDVDIFYDPEILAHIVELIFELVSVFKKLEGRTSYYEVKEKAIVVVEEKIIISKRNVFLITASMDALALTLVDYGTIFASGSLKKAELEFAVNSQQMSVVASLGDLVLLDHDEDSLYKEILGLKSKNGSFVQIGYHQLFTPAPSSDPYYNKTLKMKFNSVKFVYLQRLLNKVKAYLGSGPLMTALSEGTKKLAKGTIEVIKHQSKSVEMFEIDIEFTNPVVFVPMNYKSEDRIIGNLGNISVKSVLEKVVHTKENWIENYVIKLEKMNLKTKYGNTMKEYSVLNDTDMKFEIRRAVINPLEEVQDISMDATISKVSIVLSLHQYQMIFRFLDGNLGDKGGIRTEEAPKEDAPKTSTANNTKEMIGSIGSIIGSGDGEKTKEVKVERVTSYYKLNFPSLDLKVLRGKGYNKLGIENSLAHLVMTNFNFIYLTKSDSSTESKFSIQQISAVDLRRESQSIFKEFIKTTKIDEKMPYFIEFSYQSFKNSDSMININMGNPRIVFVPDVVLEIKDFFTNTRKPVDKKLEKTESSKLLLEGDLKFNTNVSLGEDIHLSLKRKLYIQANDSKEITLDGQGHSMFFHKEQEKSNGIVEPLVFIADGVTLYVKNLTVVFYEDLDRQIHYGKDSKLLTPTTKGVIRKQLNEQEMNSEKKDTSIVKKEEKPSRFCLVGTFGSPQVIFPENSVSKQSRLVVVEFSANLLMNITPKSTDYSLNLLGIKIGVEQEETLKKGAPILEPLKVNADIHQESHGDDSNYLIKVNFGNDIKSRISYRDVTMLINIYNAFSKKKEVTEEKKVLEDKKEPEKVPEKRKSILKAPEEEKLRRKSFKSESVEEDEQVFTASDSEENSDEFKDVEDEEFKEIEDEFKDIEEEEEEEEEEEIIKPTEDKTQKSVTVKGSTTYKVRFETKDIGIFLVDDFNGYDVPLLDFKILNMILSTKVLQSKIMEIGAELNFELYANYYNIRLANWEPILENWGCSLKFSQNQKVGEDPVRDFRLEPLEKRSNTKKIANPLNINVTKEMIDTVVTTSNLWKGGLKSDFAISEKFFPYLLKNQTGLTVQFYQGKDEKKAFKVETGKDVGFDFDEVKGQTTTSELTLVIEDMAPKTIDLKKLTKKSISDAKSKTVFIIELEFINGKKIITVRTGLGIENDTTIQWDVAISDGNKLTTLGEVKPGDFVSIPSNLIENGYLCIRPSNNKDYDWNHNVPGTKLTELIKLYSGGNRMVSCGATDPMQAAQAYYAIVQVKSAKEVPKNTSVMDTYLFQRYDFTIFLKTPLLIENLLGWPMEFELVDKTTWQAKKMSILTGTLKRGEKIHVYTANLKNLILMGCKPPGDKWKAVTLALINGPKNKNDKPLTTSLSMYDQQGSSVDFLFDYGYSTDQAFREVMIYVTHWFVNHTGLNLSIKENKSLVAGQSQSNHYKNEKDEEEDDLLMFTYKSTSTTKKISISVENSEYSNPFSIENIGTTGNLSVKSDKRRYDVGVHISLSPGKFKRTKIITFGSRYSIINKLTTSIILQQFKSDKKSTVEAGKQNLFYWPERDIENPLLSVKLQGDYKFSSPFAIKSLGESFIKVPPEKDNTEPMILSIKIMEDRATLFIVISKPEKAPYIINNKTTEDLQICQASVPNKILTVPKGSKKDFCWEDNLQPHVVILKLSNQTIQMELDKVQKEKKYSIDNLRSLYISVVSRGPSKILKVSMKDQAENSMLQMDTIETNKMNALISLDGIGISLIDATPQELAFIFIENVDLKYSQTNERTYYELKIGDLQIDNQTQDTAYPILFSSARKQPEKEYIHLSIIHSEKDPNYYPYFSFCLQEALIAIDYVFIYEIFKFYELMTTTKDEEALTLTQLHNQIKEPTIETQATKKMFSFSQFELHPIKATISFKYNKPKGEEVSHNPIMILLDSLGVTIANIDEATIKLNPLILTDPFESMDSLTEKIQTHYKRAVTTEVYKILGSLDVIGNPVGLFNDLSTGVMDFFYEPAKAIFLVQGPEEFTKGFAKGTISLVTNSVHGTFNTASKVTGSIGHGLSLLSFDKDYIREHQKTASSKPKDIREGLLEGTEAFGKSLFEGFSGVFTKPFEGAQQEGVSGFFKGVGKGLIGIPVKPVTGILDFATKTTEGISNVKNYFNNDVKGKKRLPRTFGPDGLVIPYSPSSAYGQFLLNTIANQSYAKQRPEYHIHNEKEVVLLTNRCILFIKKSNLSLDYIIDLLTIDKMQIEKETYIATIVAKGSSRKIWVDSSNSTSLKTFIDRTEQIKSRLKEKAQKFKVVN